MASTSSKIAIIDDANQEGGLKYLFPEADYYIYQRRNGTEGFFKKNKFDVLTNIEDINDEKYDTLFVIKPLYNTPTHYKKDDGSPEYANNCFVKDMSDAFNVTLRIINANTFKNIFFFVNCDYDMDPNFIFKYKTIRSLKSNIVFFKRNYSNKIEYNENVCSFPYLIFFRNTYCIIESITEAAKNMRITDWSFPKNNRVFYSGGVYHHTDEQYGVNVNRISSLNRIRNRLQDLIYIPNHLPHDIYMQEMRNSKFCLDLLGCGNPNLRTFEILEVGSLLISQRSTLQWPFPETFCEETQFDDENDLFDKIQRLIADDNLYQHCLQQQYHIVSTYMNKDAMRNYIINKIEL